MSKPEICSKAQFFVFLRIFSFGYLNLLWKKNFLHYGIYVESGSVECNTQFTQSNKSKVKLSKMVGEKSRSVYKKKRKINFSGRRNKKKSMKKPLLLLTKSPPHLRAPPRMKISSPTLTLKKLLVPPKRKLNMPTRSFL